MALRPQYPGKHDPEIDEIRKGTLQQFVSGWTKINAGASSEFSHELDEIPANVEVEYSELADGELPKTPESTSDIDATASVDPANMPAVGNWATVSVTIAGAALGDFVLFAPPIDISGVQVSAYVTAADTVGLRFENLSGAGIDLAASTWNFRIIKPRTGSVKIVKADKDNKNGSGAEKLTVTNNMSDDRYFRVRAR